MTYLDCYLSTIPGLDKSDIREINRAIRNKTPIVLCGEQMSGRTTLARVLTHLGVVVLDDHVNCMVINLKKPLDRSNMIENAYATAIELVDQDNNARI